MSLFQANVLTLKHKTSNSKLPVFKGWKKMQDKRLLSASRNSQKKHRPAVPVSFFSLLLKNASVSVTVSNHLFLRYYEIGLLLLKLLVLLRMIFVKR